MTITVKINNEAKIVVVMVKVIPLKDVLCDKSILINLKNLKYLQNLLVISFYDYHS